MSFLVSVFVGFLVLAIAVQLTHSIWAGGLPNMIVNVFVNVYMLSVRRAGEPQGSANRRACAHSVTLAAGKLGRRQLEANRFLLLPSIKTRAEACDATGAAMTSMRFGSYPR
jgi:hypothetical protein